MEKEKWQEEFERWKEKHCPCGEISPGEYFEWKE